MDQYKTILKKLTKKLHGDKKLAIKLLEPIQLGQDTQTDTMKSQKQRKRK